MTYQIISAILEIFAMFAVGWLSRHWRYLTQDTIANWSRFVLDIMMPFLILHTIVGHFHANQWVEFWVLPVLGLGIIVLGTLMGLMLKSGMKSQDTQTRKTFLHLCATNNFAFLPIIILQNLWGDSAVAMLFILHLGTMVGFWSIGVGVLGEFNWKAAGKNMLTPSLITLIVAIVIVFLDLQRWIPSIFLKISGEIGDASVPLILILIGASLYQIKIRDDLRDLIYMTVVRLILIPLVTIGILRILPISREIYNVATILALMPVASTSVILTHRYGGAPGFAAGANIVSTLCSIVTIPLWSAWVLK
ncbi:MAG: AEC family transporter [SAR324 cluster bacterium]|nr:AEC family transporter [SAR324 cluster bacterium]